MPLTVLFLLLFATAAAALTQPYNVSKLSEYHINRVKALAVDSPTLRAIRASPDLQRRLAPAYRMFASLATVAEKRVKESARDACSLRGDNIWVVQLKRLAKVFQIGEFEDKCLNIVEATAAIRQRELPSTFIADTRRTIVDARQALLEATRRGAFPFPRDTNWTADPGAPYKLSGFVAEHAGQNCSMEFLFAYRRWGRWYIQSTVTNRPINLVLKDWDRQITHEYVPQTGDASLRMPLKRIEDDVVVNASTFVLRGIGRPGLGNANLNYLEDDTSALNAALRANEVSIDVASDSVTASNIAILALPMTMSFVPVAFVADLEALGMLLYVLVTDVFAAIPFLIKGVELVRSASRLQSRSTVFHMGNSTLSQMEVWVAQCRGDDRFGTTGWVFIAVAITVIVVGITLELVAARVVKRRGGIFSLAAGEMTGQFGRGMLSTTGVSFMGGVRERERVDQFWRQSLRSDERGEAVGEAVGEEGTRTRRRGMRRES